MKRNASSTTPRKTNKKRKQQKRVKKSAIGHIIPPVFDVEDKDMLGFLAVYGFVVVSVLDQESIDPHKRRLFSTMTTCFGYDVTRPATVAGLPGIKGSTFGLITATKSGICNSRYNLDLKQASKSVFQKIYATTDLRCSFDSINVLPNKHKLCMKKSAKPLSLHIDRDIVDLETKSDGPNVYQSILLLTDSDETTGGLVVVPKSHKRLPTFMTDGKTYTTSKKGKQSFVNQFTLLNTTNTVVANALVKTPPVRLHTPAGSIVVFSNDLVHGNVPAVDPTVNTNDYLRLGTYVSFVPRRALTDPVEVTTRLIRSQYVTRGSVGNHWSEVATVHPVDAPMSYPMKRPTHGIPQSKTAVCVRLSASTMLTDYDFIE
jgi:ectoine hydroxylase-related dioxygenase (phytanoyl-CoA dioxygenase family)